jgi:ankyrin repeat protein
MAMISAVKNDHIECVKYIVLNNCPWDAEDVGRVASLHGSVKCMEWLHETGHPFEQYMIINALLNGHIEYVQLLKSIIHPQDTLLSLNAARGGSNICIKYIHSLGVEWHGSTASVLAQSGNVIGLQFAVDNKCPIDDLVCNSAARTGNIECIRIAVNHGCTITAYMLDIAAANGQIECVNYLLSMQCTSSNACRSAASRGHIDILDILKNGGHVWDETLCCVAAAHNRIKCVKYLITNDCPWNHDQLIIIAINDNNLPLLLSLIAMGCAIGNAVKLHAQTTDSTECIDYIMNMD